MSTASIMDPHDKMRARDVNKVAKGQQAPKPPHESGTVSPPPSPQSTFPPPPKDESELPPQTRHCYEAYVEFHKCIKEMGKGDPQCDKFAWHYRSLCPEEWIKRWDEARAAGMFPGI